MNHVTPISDTTNLENTWTTARANFAWADYAALLNHVPKAFLARAMATDILGADDITVKNGKWSRQFMGDRAVVIPVLGATDEVVDLVAFKLSTPKSFWLFGAGGTPMLGYEELERAIHFEEPLTVHETPLEWLKAECRGIVILDWQHYWPAYLGGVVALKYESRDFARRATALMSKPIPIPPALAPAA